MREPIVSVSIDEALNQLKLHLEYRLKQKGNGTFKSTHEILGVVAEEYHELIDAVKSNEKSFVYEELMDIAVAAVFGAACLIQNATDW